MWKRVDMRIYDDAQMKGIAKMLAGNNDKEQAALTIHAITLQMLAASHKILAMHHRLLFLKKWAILARTFVHMSIAKLGC